MQIKRSQISALGSAVKKTVTAAERESLPVIFSPQDNSMIVIAQRGFSSQKIIFRVDISYTKVPKLFGIRFDALEKVAGKKCQDTAKFVKTKYGYNIEYTNAGVALISECSEIDDIVPLAEYPKKWQTSSGFLAAYASCAGYADNDSSSLSALAYIAMGNQSMAATDGRRLICCEHIDIPDKLPTKEDDKLFLMPVLKFLPKTGEIQLGVTKSLFAIKLPEFEVFVNCAEVRFPKYRDILPGKKGKSMFDLTFTEKTVEKLKEVLPHFPIINGYTAGLGVRITVKDGYVVVESASNSTQNTRLITDIPYTDKPFDFGIDRKFLLQMFQEGFRNIWVKEPEASEQADDSYYGGQKTNQLEGYQLNCVQPNKTAAMMSCTLSIDNLKPFASELFVTEPEKGGKKLPAKKSAKKK